MDNRNINTLIQKVDEKGSLLLKWFEIPKEQARQHLMDAVEKSESLSEIERVALISNSRKLVREYSNSKSIYEKAKAKFENVNNEAIDEDWIHFFFDKACKVSNESLQTIWAMLLSGEYNQPGSVSRKLLHTISVMDANDAIAFSTFSKYVFERSNMLNLNYDTEAILLPKDFYNGKSFDFMRKIENWLNEAGYENYKDLAFNLTLNNAQLNSLENLNLIQQVPKNTCGLNLQYKTDNKIYYIKPENDLEIPLGEYAFTSEGKQLYKIIGSLGINAIIEIIKNYFEVELIDVQIDEFKL